ncbi:MAG: hypothetical protein QM775_23635 [Pirellulales bacterium]
MMIGPLGLSSREHPSAPHAPSSGRTSEILVTSRFVRSAVPRFRYVAASLLAFGGLASLVGCREQDDITIVTEPHEASISEAARGPAAAPAKVPARLLGALVDHGSETWFFKALGPDAVVAREVAQVKALLVGLKFENGQPVWKLPEGWTEHRKNPGRFATLIIGDAQPPLELAVSRFPGNQNLADNVNRWRGQVGLANQTPEEVEKSIEQIKSAAGTAQLRGTRRHVFTRRSRHAAVCRRRLRKARKARRPWRAAMPTRSRPDIRRSTPCRAVRWPVL